MLVYECMSVCKIALVHVNVCISQQSRMSFDGFMCFLHATRDHLSMHVCPNNQMHPARKKSIIGAHVCIHMHALFIIKVCACACAIHVSVMHSNQEQKQPSIQNTRDTIPKISSHPQSDTETMASSSARRNTYSRTYMYTPTCTHTHTYTP